MCLTTWDYFRRQVGSGIHLLLNIPVVSDTGFFSQSPPISHWKDHIHVLVHVWVDSWKTREIEKNLLLSCILTFLKVRFSSVQSLSRVRLFATPWTAARQASLSITYSQSLPMSIESVIPSNHLIPCRPLLLLPSIFPSIRVFSNESALRIRWPKYWSFSFSISPSNEHPGLITLGWTGWISLQSKGLSRVFSNTTVQKHQFFCAQLSL